LAKSLVVVHVEDGPHNEAVRSLARTWTEIGLLDTSFWIRDAGDAASLHGELLAPRSEVQNLRMVEALAAEAYPSVTFVALRLITDAAEAETMGNERVEAISNFLFEQLSQGFQSLERLNLIVPVTRLNQVPSKLVIPRWRANVVVAAEDRISSAHADGLVEEDGGFAEHAMLALATNTGLWAIAESPGTRIHSTTTDGTPTVRVTRSFARGIFGDDVVGQITDGVMQGFAAPELPPLWLGIEVEEYPAIAVSEAITEFLSQPGNPFRFRNPGWLPMAGRNVFGIWAAIKIFLSYIWNHIKGIPARAVDRVVQTVQQAAERFVQSVTFGADSTIRVRFGGRAAKAYRSVELKDVAEEILRELNVRQIPAMPADGWNITQRMVFRLADPTDPEKSTSRSIVQREFLVPVGGHEVVLHSDLGQLSEIMEDLEEWIGVAVHPCDARAYSQMIDCLDGCDSKIEETKAENAKLRPPPPPPPPLVAPLAQRLETETPTVTVEVEEHDLEAPDPEQDGIAESSSDEVESRETTVSAGALGELEVTPPSSIDRLGPDEELLATYREELDEWVRSRRESAVWQLGARIDSSIRESENVFSETLKIALERPEDYDPDDDKRVWGGIKKFGLGFALGAIAAVLLTFIFPLWILLAIPILLAMWIFFSFRSVQEMFQARYRADDRWDHYLAALHVLPRQAIEVTRLQGLYVDFLEWATLMAAVVHPRQIIEPPTEKLDISSLRFPKAGQFQLAEMDPVGRSAAIAVMGRKTFGPGWLEEYYLDAMNGSRRKIAAGLGIDEEQISNSPFHGVYRAKMRDLIVEAIGSMETINEWREEIFAEAMLNISSEKFAVLFPKVSAGAGETGSIEFFDQLIARESAAGGEQFGLTVWSPVGLADQSVRVHQTYVAGPDVLVGIGDGADYAAITVRLDISDELLVDRIRLFDGIAVEPVAARSFDTSGIG
jgi:hypothetical protein